MSTVFKYDRHTNEGASFSPTDVWWDGTPMDDSKVDNVIYVKALSSEGGGYMKRNFTGPANIEWFGARGDGITDSTEAIKAAFSLDIDLDLPTGIYNISDENIQLADNKIINGYGSTLKINTYLILGNNNKINDLSIDGATSTGISILGRGVSGVKISNLKLNNTQSIGLQFDNNCDDIILTNCEIKNCINQGVFFQDCANIKVSNSIFSDNNRDGLTFYRCSNFSVDSCFASGNGDTGYNGISANDSQYGSFSDIITTSNAEHGIGCQGSSNIVFSNVISYSNGQSGIFLQSGTDSYTTPFRPCEDIVIDGSITKNNLTGISLISDNRNVIISNTIIKGNTTYRVRLLERGGDGLFSTNVLISNCSLDGGVTNGNSSTGVFEKNNSVGSYNGPTLPFITIAESLTLNIAGPLLSYPTLFYITPTGTDIARISKGQSRAGTMITLVASGGDIVIRNNAGDGTTYSGFIFKVGENFILKDGCSITFVCSLDRNTWQEISSSITHATPLITGAVKQATTQADSTGTDLATLTADYNSLLAKLRTAGILAT